MQPAQAETAVYVAFEGFRDQEPSLAGVLIEDEFLQYVCDRIFKPAAAAKMMPFAEFPDLVAELESRCRSEDRLIIGWSTDELAALSQVSGAGITDLYHEARTTAVRWVTECHPDEDPRDWQLIELMSLVDYERPPHLGFGKSARRLRAVRKMIERKGDFEDLTGTVKGQWTKLLQNNEADCRGLQAVITAASGDLCVDPPR